MVNRKQPSLHLSTIKVHTKILKFLASMKPFRIFFVPFWRDTCFVRKLTSAVKAFLHVQLPCPFSKFYKIRLLGCEKISQTGLTRTKFSKWWVLCVCEDSGACIINGLFGLSSFLSKLISFNKYVYAKPGYPSQYQSVVARGWISATALYLCKRK